jgi:hypothetical protein
MTTPAVTYFQSATSKRHDCRLLTAMAAVSYLTINADRILIFPGLDQSWRIQVDEPHPNMA